MKTVSILIEAPSALSPLLIKGTAGGDRLTGTARNDTVFGYNDDDRIASDDGNDRIFGGAGDDRVDAGAGRDFIRGDDGDDRLDGDAGDDFLYGGRGNDRLNGGAGSDYLACHGGVDFVTGGTGVDRFVFTQSALGTTTIEDFDQGIDRLMYFTKGTEAGTFRSFMAGATQQGADTVFVGGGLRLILLNVDRADLTAADFFTYL